jgi:surfactin synthase thioesterase subunit
MTIVPLGGSGPARVRLLCLPHAGGGPYVFRTWAARLPPWLEVLGVELPGRGRQISAAPLDRMTTLVERLGPLLPPLLDRPYLVFGHSMGALLGFEMVRWCKRMGLRQPHRLFVSGRNAPQTPPRPPLHQLPEEEFVARVLEYEGSPPEVFADPELRALFVAVLRADFAAVETHPFAAEPRLDCDLEALIGEQDPGVTAEQAERWAELTTGRASLTRFPGGHFFVQSAEHAVVARVAEAAAAARPG